MGFEDIEVRITRQGEIYIKIEGCHEERLRDYFMFLEETVGPVKAKQVIDRKDWELPASIARNNDHDEDRKQEMELET